MCEGIEYVDFLFKNLLCKIVHKRATVINIVILYQKFFQISKITFFSSEKFVFSLKLSRHCKQQQQISFSCS